MSDEYLAALTETCDLPHLCLQRKIGMGSSTTTVLFLHLTNTIKNASSLILESLALDYLQQNKRPYEYVFQLHSYSTTILQRNVAMSQCRNVAMSQCRNLQSCPSMRSTHLHNHHSRWLVHSLHVLMAILQSRGMLYLRATRKV